MARVLAYMTSDDDELRRRGYSLGSSLGEGSYAKVKWATSEKQGGRKVALKIISKRKAPADFQQKFLPRELEVMKRLDHPHIIKLFEVLYFNDKIVLVLEMAGHGDLLEYVKLRGAVQEDKAKVMYSQLVSAVDYLHTLDLVHRDLKCENILLDVENRVKLSDFGFSRIQHSDQMSKTYCGSAAYAAPEVLQGIPYHGTAYDVWSLGVILYIMVCGSMPYDDSDVKKMIRNQLERKVGFSRSKKISDEVKHLIHCILEAKVHLRYTVTDIKSSTWLQSTYHQLGLEQLSQPVASGGGGMSAESVARVGFGGPVAIASPREIISRPTAAVTPVVQENPPPKTRNIGNTSGASSPRRPATSFGVWKNNESRDKSRTR